MLEENVVASDADVDADVDVDADAETADAMEETVRSGPLSPSSAAS